MKSDIETKRTLLIHFVRNTVYRALGIVTAIVLLVILYLQSTSYFTHGPITALLTIVAAWIVLFICEYNVFLLKNFSSEIIERLYRHVESFLIK